LQNKYENAINNRKKSQFIATGPVNEASVQFEARNATRAFVYIGSIATDGPATRNDWLVRVVCAEAETLERDDTTNDREGLQAMK
jgi:hypothetical protein